ncbi:MAG: hypothetical protein R3F34_09530 [Planctomycetota bacterium]
MKHHVPTSIAIVLTSITVAVLSTCRGPAPRSVAPTPAQQTPEQDPEPAQMADINVTGDVRTIGGANYSGVLTLCFDHDIDGKTYSYTRTEWVTDGELDATISMPNVRVGMTVNVDAWQGSTVANRSTAVFFSGTEGYGFHRSTFVGERVGVPTLPLGLSYLSRPPLVAEVTVGESTDTGDATLMITPGARTFSWLRAVGRRESGAVPRTVDAYSWNAADVLTIALEVDGLFSEVYSVPREGSITVPIPKYAELAGTFSATSYPSVSRIGIFPSADYVAFTPTKPVGYERRMEAYYRLLGTEVVSPDDDNPGTFADPYLLPSTAYTIELWSRDALSASVPLAVATVTTGASGSTTTLVVP